MKQVVYSSNLLFLYMSWLLVIWFSTQIAF